MSVGKYSPTVSASYAHDQKWREKIGGGYGNGKNPDSDLDDDGYDSYGYLNGNGPDRAGHTELDYLTPDVIEYEDRSELEYYLYGRVAREWWTVVIGRDPLPQNK